MLRTILFSTFLLVCALVNAEEDQKLEGWRNFTKHKPNDIELAVKPTVKVLTVKDNWATLKVTNKSNVDIEYSAEGKQNPKIYAEDKIEGKWVSERWHWCGTGQQIYSIPKNKSVKLKIELTGESERIYTIFRQSDHQNAWSLVLLYSKDK